MVTLGGGVKFVQCVGGGGHRGVETECHIGGAQVVVDGIGHTHHR